MKTNMLKKFTLALVLFTGTISGLSTFAGQNTLLGANAPQEYCGVNHDDIVGFMEEMGYMVFSVAPYEECSVRIDTDRDYDTVVYLESGTIVGWEDIR